MNQTLNNSRIDELDSLRGIAAISVVIFHYTTRYSEIFQSNETIKNLNFPFGHYGVEFFFIISGFVIFLTVRKTDSIWKFIYNRIIRLYPTFWVCMLLTFVFVQLFGQKFLQVSATDLAVNFTMVPSLLNAKPVDGVYWSLIPEIFFYSLMGILLATNQLKRITLIGYIWMVLIFLNLMNISYFNYFDGLLNLKYGMFFLIGINFYHVHNKISNYHNHIQIILAGILGYLFNQKLENFIVVSSFIAIFYLFVNSKLKFIATPQLRLLGRISYPLYLLHQFIGYIIISYLIRMQLTNQAILILVPLIISGILSFGILEFIEKPAIKKLKSLSSNSLFYKSPFRVKKIPTREVE